MDMNDEEALPNEALNLGLKGYLLKLSGSHSLVRFAFDHRAKLQSDSFGLRHSDFGFLFYVFPRRPFCVFTRIPKRPLSCHTLGLAMRKILIADDNARMRQMIKQIVAGLASEVYEASDGGEAIVVCAAQRPDWVLMDFRTRTMNGLAHRATTNGKG
jgi:PleD family two-component response regulator